MASSSHNVELEAAKFLQKLIQESKDEPAKLATKLHVILQHMKASGKENSMSFQVISRAMETVISQNGLDIEGLKSSRLPPNTSAQPEKLDKAHDGMKAPPALEPAVTEVGDIPSCGREELDKADDGMKAPPALEEETVDNSATMPEEAKGAE